MRSLSEICHELEHRVAEEGGPLDGAEMAPLYRAWDKAHADLQMLIGERDRRSIEIDDADLRALRSAVLSGADRYLVARMIESWRLEPTAKRLHRIEQQLKGLAERMGKSEVEVAVEPNGLRFNSERFMPFWSAFIHVLRNAVDHGVEAAEQRQQSGKSEPPAIKVSTSVDEDRFIVAVEDNGPGVDWETLRTKARAMGVGEALLGDTERLICLPGLSSKANVTELSGRGVGMSAARDACESLGGAIKVDSRRGAGTRIRFVFPKDHSVYEGHAALFDSESALAPAGA